jgi:hypothetical protein
MHLLRFGICLACLSLVTAGFAIAAEPPAPVRNADVEPVPGVAPPAHGPESRAGTVWIFAVAVDHYERISGLAFCGNDALGAVAVFRDRFRRAI